MPALCFRIVPCEKLAGLNLDDKTSNTRITHRLKIDTSLSYSSFLLALKSLLLTDLPGLIIPTDESTVHSMAPVAPMPAHLTGLSRPRCDSVKCDYSLVREWST